VPCASSSVAIIARRVRRRSALHHAVVGRAFHAEVAAQLVVAAVAVALAVGLVVLARIRHQVGEGEAVVHGNEVHRRGRLALVVAEQVVGSAEAARELAAVDAAAQPVAAHGVAELVVPFQEAAGEAARPGSRRRPASQGSAIRRAPASTGSWRSAVKKAGVRIEAMAAAAEHGREVEAEAVNAPSRAPSKRSESSTKRVTCGLATLSVLPQPLRFSQRLRSSRVSRYQLAWSRPRKLSVGPYSLPSGRVVVDHVEHDLDALGMQRLHHGAEFRRGIRRLARQARIGGEEAERVVAPVVDHAALGLARLRRGGTAPAAATAW
jgi:hypothetical protein